MATSLSAHDLKIIATAFACLETSPRIDYDKLTTAMGWANRKTTQSIWCVTKKKLLAWTTVEAPDKTPLPLGKAKRKADDNERHDSASPAPPLKKKRKPKKDDSDEEDATRLSTFIPPRPRQRATKKKKNERPDEGATSTYVPPRKAAVEGEKVGKDGDDEGAKKKDAGRREVASADAVPGRRIVNGGWRVGKDGLEVGVGKAGGAVSVAKKGEVEMAVGAGGDEEDGQDGGGLHGAVGGVG